MKTHNLFVLPLLAIAGCSQQTAVEPAPQAQFFTKLAELCGSAFQGKLVSEDPVDAGTTWATAKMVIHVRDCSEDEIRIPLHVDENRSRTWVISRTDTGLRLKHDHRHEDGAEDAVSQYGGDTVAPGSAGRQEFPVDDYSKDLFLREGLDVSVDNVWAVEVMPGKKFAYELTRPNRMFRAEFDLSQPVDLPPPAWGWEDD